MEPLSKRAWRKPAAPAGSPSRSRSPSRPIPVLRAARRSPRAQSRAGATKPRRDRSNSAEYPDSRRNAPVARRRSPLPGAHHRGAFGREGRRQSSSAEPLAKARSDGSASPRGQRALPSLSSSGLSGRGLGGRGLQTAAPGRERRPGPAAKPRPARPTLQRTQPRNQAMAPSSSGKSLSDASSSSPRLPQPGKTDAISRNLADVGSFSESESSDASSESEDEAEKKRRKKEKRARKLAKMMEMFDPAMMAGKGMFMPWMLGDPAGKGGFDPLAAPYGSGMFPAPWGWPPPPPYDGGCGIRDKGGKGKRKGGGKGHRRKGGSRSRSRDGKDHNDEEGKCTEYVKLPRSLMGRVIGKHGSSIKQIRESSGARIDAEDLQHEDLCELKICGDEDAVLKAKDMILEISEKAQNERNGRGERNEEEETDELPHSESLMVPRYAIGRVIGRQGATIKRVRKESGARIKVEDIEGKDECEFKISASTAEAALQAKGKLQEIMDQKIKEKLEKGAKESGEKLSKDGPDKEKQLVEAPKAPKGQGHRDTLKVPKSLIGRIIGRAGKSIQRLHQETGAKIDVDTSEGDPCSVRLSGSRESVSQARFMIFEILDKSSSARNAKLPEGQLPAPWFPPPPGAPWQFPGYGPPPPPPPGPWGPPGDPSWGQAYTPTSRGKKRPGAVPKDRARAGKGDDDANQAPIDLDEL